MKIQETDFNGLFVIEPDVHKDERGFFYEMFNSDKLKHVISCQFAQDNLSCSKKNTMRGLHFQTGIHKQGKLCQTLRGAVMDVVVDIRKSSPTFGKHFKIELNDTNHLQFWIPPGFAHGFKVLSDEALFAYKCTNFYNREFEKVLLYNEPFLGIDWGSNDLIISEKDKKGESWDQLIPLFDE